MSNQTVFAVFALYHADCTKPIGVYATEKLAFEAIEVNVAYYTATDRKEYDVVQFNVRNEV
jgi:hypothetical protein